MSIKMGEIRGMKQDLLEKKLGELEMERLTGGSGNKAKSIKLSIARIKTYIAQLGNKQPTAPVKPKKNPNKKAAAKSENKPLNKGKGK